MKVYKIFPRLVFLSNNKVYKFFNNSKECEDEINKINSSPFSEHFDSDTKYNMKFVKILHVDKYFYIMRPVKGLCLNDTKSIYDYKLAGSWLRIFHNFSYDEQSKKAFLFSDFDISHVYVNHNNNEITAIDPGTGFGTIGEIENDISRLIVSLMQKKSFNVLILKQHINSFLDGYKVDKIDYDKLDKHINERIKKNTKKMLKLNFSLKQLLIGKFLFIFSNLKYILVKKNIKKIINKTDL